MLGYFSRLKKATSGWLVGCVVVCLLLTLLLKVAYSPQLLRAAQPLPAPAVSRPAEVKWSRPAEIKWSPTRKILLFTYARSGSSLTGDIIHHSPDVYYVFEPLRTLLKREVNLKTQRVEPVLQSVWSCNFTASLLRDLDQGFLRRNNDTLVLSRCFGLVKVNKTDCLKKAQSVCQGHDKILIKSIRVSATTVTRLMALNPDLAVIFLVRDPRGSIWSRMTVFKEPTLSTLPPFARELCDTILQDTAGVRTLSERYADRVGFLRYEDLVRHPVEVARNIYRFLNLTWAEHVQSAILKQTGSGNSTTVVARPAHGRAGRATAFTTTRADAYTASMAWRQSMPWNVTDTIQQECQALMEVLSYTSLPSPRELTALSSPSYGRFELVEGLNTPGRVDLGRTDLGD